METLVSGTSLWFCHLPHWYPFATSASCLFFKHMTCFACQSVSGLFLHSEWATFPHSSTNSCLLLAENSPQVHLYSCFLRQPHLQHCHWNPSLVLQPLWLPSKKFRWDIDIDITKDRWLYYKIKLDSLKGKNGPWPLKKKHHSWYDFNMP